MKKRLCIALFLLANALNLSKSPCIARAGNILILENGVYFNGNTFRPFRKIVIADGKVRRVNPIILPRKKFTRFDCHGKYIIPGLIDAHVHLMACPTDNFASVPPQNNLNSALLCGNTTVIDLFSVERPYRKLIDNRYCRRIIPNFSAAH